MLTKNEKYVLDFINSKYDVGENVDTADIWEQSELLPGVFDATCEQLYKKGYFDGYSDNFARCSHEFLTTYKSANYEEISRLEEKEFIIRSIAVPIIVGIVSAVIASLIASIYHFHL